MANVPTVHFVRRRDSNVSVVCIMTFADLYNDGFKGVNYANYDVATGKLVGRGFSKGREGTGLGSMISATENAKRAAHRYISRRLGGAT